MQKDFKNVFVTFSLIGVMLLGGSFVYYQKTAEAQEIEQQLEISKQEQELLDKQAEIARQKAAADAYAAEQARLQAVADAKAAAAQAAATKVRKSRAS